jgi:hypothetical protein
LLLRHKSYRAGPRALQQQRNIDRLVEQRALDLDHVEFGNLDFDIRIESLKPHQRSGEKIAGNRQRNAEPPCRLMLDGLDLYLQKPLAQARVGREFNRGAGPGDLTLFEHDMAVS